MDAKRELEQAAELLGKVLRRLAVTQGDVELGVALLEEGAREHAVDRRRQERHAVAHDARDLEQPLVRQPRLAKAPYLLGGLEVGLGGHHAAVRPREPERAPQRTQIGLLESGALCHLGERVTLAAVTRERPLERQQAQAIVLDRLAQFLQRGPVARQLTNQPRARLALPVVSQPVEQALSLRVDVLSP